MIFGQRIGGIDLDRLVVGRADILDIGDDEAIVGQLGIVEHHAGGEDHVAELKGVPSDQARPLRTLKRHLVKVASSASGIVAASAGYCMPLTVSMSHRLL